ncbi:MAG: citrulline utilization hydrolase CtlX [Vicinamibacteria bacterium]
MNQSAQSVLMIEPVAFGFNPDSARTNSFMHSSGGRLRAEEVQAAALREFHGLVERLSEEGVEVLVRRDRVEAPSADSIFPNNWVTFHEDGRAVLYPMEPPNRRRERRLDILDWLRDKEGFFLRQVVDLSPHEDEGRFLEGTGSMVFDRRHDLVYASISPRTTPSLLREFGERFGLEVSSFHAFDRDGSPVYHTNVVLALGSGLAVFCAEAVRDPSERRSVASSLERGGGEVVEITMEQLYAFAGNLLELRDRAGDPVLAISERAWSSLTPEQIRRLERHGRMARSPIPTIEEQGGGSVRCMLAEVFLPRA